jgi:hypothetical protein
VRAKCADVTYDNVISDFNEASVHNLYPWRPINIFPNFASPGAQPKGIKARDKVDQRFKPWKGDEGKLKHMGRPPRVILFLSERPESITKGKKQEVDSIRYERKKIDKGDEADAIQGVEVVQTIPYLPQDQA